MCANQLVGGLLLKKLKYFEVMLSIFEFTRALENVESWLVYASKLFWIAQPYISTNIIKQSKCYVLFLAFKIFNEKNKVSYKGLLFSSL